MDVGAIFSWQLPTAGSQLNGGNVAQTKAWLLMMKRYIVNIRRTLAVEELWEQIMYGPSLREFATLLLVHRQTEHVDPGERGSSNSALPEWSPPS